MSEDNPLEPTHERRVTWGLIAVVAIFVLLMTGIVLWVTTSLIHNRPGGSGALAAQKTPAPHATGLVTTASVDPSNSGLVEGTTMPAEGSDSGNGRFVRYEYWYVSPSSIKLGECAQISWQAKNAKNMKLYRDNHLILDNAPTTGTYQDCPTKLGYNVYRMVSLNKFNESNWIQLQVRVQQGP